MKTGPFYSIFASKCPKCNLGDLYLDSNPYHLKKLGDMHKSCSCCDQVYEPETGFYYGAMYVSYGLSIILMFIPAAVLYFGFDAGFPVLLATVLGIYILSFPLVFRWSRNIWLNMFVRFDPQAHQQARNSIA
jgi:Protein of unknown function (DUF983)